MPNEILRCTHGVYRSICPFCSLPTDDINEVIDDLNTSGRKYRIKEREKRMEAQKKQPKPVVDIPRVIDLD